MDTWIKSQENFQQPLLQFALDISIFLRCLSRTPVSDACIIHSGRPRHTWDSRSEWRWRKYLKVTSRAPLLGSDATHIQPLGATIPDKIVDTSPLPPIQCCSTLSSGRTSLVGLLFAEPTLNPGEGVRKKSFWDRLGVVRCIWLMIFRKMDKINPCVNTFCPGLYVSRKRAPDLYWATITEPTTVPGTATWETDRSLTDFQH